MAKETQEKDSSTNKKDTEEIQREIHDKSVICQMMKNTMEENKVEEHREHPQEEENYINSLTILK